jgi:hypothetical protein
MLCYNKPSQQGMIMNSYSELLDSEEYFDFVYENFDYLMEIGLSIEEAVSEQVLFREFLEEVTA